MELSTHSKIVLIASFGIAILFLGTFYYEEYGVKIRDNAIIAEQKKNYPDKKRERRLAEAYWSRYPDVRDDWYFGQNGRLGVYGARVHYERHGKQGNGRVWPTLK